MKHLTITLMLFLLVISTWAGTLTDNFDDGNFNGWWRAKLGDPVTQWSVADREVVSISKNACGIQSALMVGDNTWVDYEFECQFKIEKVFRPACGQISGAGVGTRTTDGNVLHELNYGVQSKDGVVWQTVCGKTVQGNWQELHRKNFVIEKGKWYAMRAVADGNQHKMFIDDKLICDFRADFPDKGNLLIWGGNCEVHFALATTFPTGT